MNQTEIAAAQTMQIATVGASVQPWICSVYFVLHQGCFYWLSYPTRRHSNEIEKNARIALAIVVKDTMPVAGVQIEGSAAKVTDTSEMEPIIEAYAAKYNQAEGFVGRYKAGVNRHILYKCVVERAVAFDERTTSDPQFDITMELNT